MDREQFLNSIKAIGTTEDEVQRRELLTKLSEDVSTIFDSNDKLQVTNDKLTQENKQYCDDNETLRKANMQLFLRVGTEKTEEEIKTNQTGEVDEEEPKPREFKDLFDEKGGLK